MNPKLEACRACPNQCWLQREAVRIVDVFAEKRNSEQLASQISIVSGRGRNEFNCPSSEIRRVREDIAKATKDKKAERLALHANYAMVDFSFHTNEFNASLPLGQQRSVRGDRR